jgi:tRNA(Ile2) C34 agmatinyltransferase TiaS
MWIAHEDVELVGSRPKCPDCGTTLEARGSNGIGVYCPNGLCNS